MAAVRQRQYARCLGVQAEREPVVFAMVKTMIEMPLPYPWKEAVDDKCRIYFYNAATGAAAWSNPLQPMHSALCDAVRRVVAASDPKFAAIGELEVLAREVESELVLWREVVPETGGDSYFYHVETQETSWENPRDRLVAQLSAKANIMSSASQLAEFGPPSPTPPQPVASPAMDAVSELEAMTREVEMELTQWREVVPEGGGRSYFYHMGTKQTTWENPRDRLMAQLAAKAQSLGFRADVPKPQRQLQQSAEGSRARGSEMRGPDAAPLVAAWHPSEVSVNGKLQARHREGAALKIQHRWRRNVLFRKRTSQAMADKVDLRRYAHAARVVQHAWRGHREHGRAYVAKIRQMQALLRSTVARARLLALRGEQERLRRLGAITAVQAACRSYLAGSALGARGVDRAVEQAVAALRMQTTWRGACARKKVKQKRSKLAGLLSLQRATRGFLQRKKFRLQLRENRQAIIDVQSVLRGYLARQGLVQEMHNTHLMEKAVLRIQRYARGTLGRRVARHARQTRQGRLELEQRRQKSALVIQSRWRGWNSWRECEGLRRERKLQNGRFTKVSFSGPSGGVWLGPPGSKLGVQVDDDCQICSVDPRGLVAAWNRVNRAHEVRVGDAIVSLNGKTEAQQINEEMRSANIVDILVAREGAMQVGPELRIDKAKGTALGVRGSSLGLEFNLFTLEIIRINAGGVLAVWNAENSPKVVAPGDKLVSVNGHTRISEIIEALRGTCVVDIVVDRPLPDSADDVSSDGSTGGTSVEVSPKNDNGAEATGQSHSSLTLSRFAYSKTAKDIDMDTCASEDGLGLTWDAAVDTLKTEAGVSQTQEILGDNLTTEDKLPARSAVVTPSVASDFVKEPRPELATEDPPKDARSKLGTPPRLPPPKVGAPPFRKTALIEDEFKSLPVRSSEVIEESGPNRGSATKDELLLSSVLLRQSSEHSLEESPSKVARQDAVKSRPLLSPARSSRPEVVLTPAGSEQARLVAQDSVSSFVAKKVLEITERGRIYFDMETGVAKVRVDVKFRPRKFTPGHVDDPTAQFDNPIGLVPLFEDVVELYNLYPFAIELVRFNGKSAEERSFGAAHEKWKQSLAKNRAERVKKALEDAGIPKGRCIAKVEDDNRKGMLFRFHIDVPSTSSAQVGAASAGTTLLPRQRPDSRVQGKVKSRNASPIPVQSNRLALPGSISARRASSATSPRPASPAGSGTSWRPAGNPGSTRLMTPRVDQNRRSSSPSGASRSAFEHSPLPSARQRSPRPNERSLPFPAPRQASAGSASAGSLSSAAPQRCSPVPRRQASPSAGSASGSSSPPKRLPTPTGARGALASRGGSRGPVEISSAMGVLAAKAREMRPDALDAHKPKRVDDSPYARKGLPSLGASPGSAPILSAKRNWAGNRGPGVGSPSPLRNAGAAQIMGSSRSSPALLRPPRAA